MVRRPTRSHDPGLLSPPQVSLLIDQYELTMSASYLRQGLNESAIFELFVRRLPPNRDWLLAAGLGPTLELIRELRFGERELEYLRSLELFADDFLDYLAAFRFSGDLEAVPEGTVCFANEPLVRVTAPRIDAQLLETVLLNQINFQTMAATKAARIVLAAGGGEAGAGERVLDFSPRRDHGVDAAMKVARSAAVAGCGGTSNVAAAMRYGLRPVGTMAHSYVLSFDSEEAAFRCLHGGLPGDRRDAGRHLRHARRCAPRDLRLARRRRQAGGGPTRLGRPAGAVAGGSPAARRGGDERDADRRKRRPRRGPDRRAGRRRRTGGPVGRGHRPRDQPRLTGRQRRLQAGRRQARETAGGGSGSCRRTRRRCPARSRCSAAMPGAT